MMHFDGGRKKNVTFIHKDRQWNISKTLNGFTCFAARVIFNIGGVQTFQGFQKNLKSEALNENSSIEVRQGLNL